MDKVWEWETHEAVDTLKQCGILPGMTVMDFGCGLGHYTVPASIATGLEGKVYAIDSNNWIILELEKRLMEQQNNNIILCKMDEKNLTQFHNCIDFIMYYDMFHAQKHKNKNILDSFYHSLSDNGILSFAVFSEIELIQDPVNGPKTLKGKPSWFRVSYSEALEHYKVILTIESCGFELIHVIEGKGIHFDDYRNKRTKLPFMTLERRDIYNFRKVTHRSKP